MTKFKLTPDPTFKAAVDVPVHGGGAAEVTFTFKHRPKTELQAFLSEANQSPETDAVAYESDLILKMAEGWDLEDEFNAENVQRLVSSYGGAASATLETYIKHMTGGGRVRKE